MYMWAGSLVVVTSLMEKKAHSDLLYLTVTCEMSLAFSETLLGVSDESGLVPGLGPARAGGDC